MAEALGAIATTDMALGYGKDRKSQSHADADVGPQHRRQRAPGQRLFERALAGLGERLESGERDRREEDARVVGKLGRAEIESGEEEGSRHGDEGSTRGVGRWVKTHEAQAHIRRAYNAMTAVGYRSATSLSIDCMVLRMIPIPVSRESVVCRYKAMHLQPWKQ